MATSERDDDDYGLMREVFSALPSAVVVIDEGGIIRRANHSAGELLDCPELEGKRWLEVLATAFSPRNDDGREISTRTGRRLQVTTLPLRAGQLIHMTDLTETRLLQDKLAHMERLSSLGRMAASLAHQIRTPLSAAILYAANLGNSNLMPSARKRFQEKLMGRLEALEAQVSDILMFARSNEQTVSELDAVSLLTATVSNVTAVVTKAQVLLETEAPSGPLPILGNASALTGALSNLIANAVEAGATHIKVRLSCADGKVSLAVANNGPAIPADLRTKIFEPFFTSKSSGTGLGLAVVTAVTKVHQGTLTLGSWEPPFDTVFTLTIPLYQHPEGESALSVEPQATAEPTSEPTSELTAEPTSELTAEPTSELTAEPTSEPTSEAPLELTPEATPVLTSELTPEPSASALLLAGRTLPPTAADVSPSAAAGANSATSAAFAAYLKRHQQEGGAQLYAAVGRGTAALSQTALQAQPPGADQADYGSALPSGASSASPVVASASADTYSRESLGLNEFGHPKVIAPVVSAEAASENGSDNSAAGSADGERGAVPGSATSTGSGTGTATGSSSGTGTASGIEGAFSPEEFEQWLAKVSGSRA